MKLNSVQLRSYADNGFLLVKRVFFNQEINTLLKVLDKAIEDYKVDPVGLEGLVLEKDQESIRTINGLHLKYDIFRQLCCYSDLVLSAQQLVDDNNLYVHQFKVNFKEAFTGDIWNWHQDYIYWLKGDGMPEPRAISVVIFLDDVTEFNGPLMFIPKSHTVGVVDVESQQINSDQRDWISNVTAKLRYTATKEVITKLVKKWGITAPKAKKGSVLFFNSNILHASGSNLSPFSRRFILITYNPVSNVNANLCKTRPEFLAARDFTPISIESGFIEKK